MSTCDDIQRAANFDVVKCPCDDRSCDIAFLMLYDLGIAIDRWKVAFEQGATA
jgi:hypothetical protein